MDDYKISLPYILFVAQIDTYFKGWVAATSVMK